MKRYTSEERYIQVMLLLISLMLFVLGAGAPFTGGGPGG